MSFLRSARGFAALFLLIGLSGCGIPDLVAHGVKEIEKSNRSGGQSSSPPQQSQPQYQSRTEEEPPPPSTPAAARRSSVTVEELKP